MKIKFTILLLLFVGIGQSVLSQKAISGTVTDEDGTPVLGATIRIENSNRGTQTDFDGNYSLSAAVGEVITVSYIGYVTQSVPIVEDRVVYNVTLVEDQAQLEEVVVVGYGKQRKEVLTSSVAQIDGEELAEETVLNATQALQGKAAGVQVIASDAPGAASTVLVRGLGTVQGGRQPLYVVDGVLTDNINNINTADIESVNVLKDAASLAIYGNRGANGVVIVTTKKGRSGEMQINFNFYSGFRSILNRVELANAEQYVTYSNEAALRDLRRDNDPSNDNDTGNFIPTDQQYDTNWLDEITRTGIIRDYYLSLAGGSEKINSFFSVGFNEEEGILLNNDFNRLTARSNVDYQISDKLTFSHKVGMQLATGSPQSYGLFTAAYKQAPIIPARREDGSFGSSIALNNVANPLIDASNAFKREKNKFFKLQGAFRLNYEILEALTFTSRFSVETEYGRFYNFRNRLGRFLADNPSNTESSFEGGVDNPARTRLTVTHTNTYRWFVDNFATYDTTFNDVHGVNLTVGITAEESQNELLSATRNNVPLDNNLNFSLFNGDEDETQLNTGFISPKDRLHSYLARLNYNYESKYLFGGSFRRDGSSRFQPGSRYGNFYAISGGWVITEEDFFDYRNLNRLKLRASYGQLGNQNVPLNIVTATTGAGGFYAFGPNQALQQGITITGTIQENLSWEVTEEVNIGLEYALFDYRLTGEIEAYQRVNTNAILEIELPDVVGFDPFNSSVGEVTNQGIEFSAQWTDEINEDLSYSVGGNFTYNENEISEVTNPFFNEQLGGFLNNGEYTKRIALGQPLGSFYLYEVEGIDDNGELVYRDNNENGVIDEGDRRYFGSYVPKYYGGINLSLKYKNFDFTTDLFYNFGNVVYNGKRAQRFGNENIEERIYNSRFTSGRSSTTTRRAFNEVPRASNYYLESGDFLRVNSVTLGYTLPENWVKYFDKIRIYATARNPLIFQAFSGFTPELPGDPLGSGGIELDAYPTLRSFYFGLNTSF